MGKMGIAALTTEFLTINFGSMAAATILTFSQDNYYRFNTFSPVTDRLDGVTDNPFLVTAVH